jgi:hypothetical protein
MDAIEAEDKPRTYLEASLFSAEMDEFGAYWHGLGWGMHTIIGDDFPLGDEWKWKGKHPDSFKPTVYVGPRVVRVTFYSYSRLGQEAIFRHVDSYKKGMFRCTKSESRNIATGPYSVCAGPGISRWVR